MAAPDCHHQLTLVWRRDRYLSEAAVKFREFTKTKPLTTHRLTPLHRVHDTRPSP